MVGLARMADAEKQCPYCKEAVKADAVKCRYCQSQLTVEVPKDGAGSVTYVLDAGLVKFGKFAAVVLALFFGFGIYVFGFNLEKSADKLSNAREAIDKKMEDMNKKAAEAEKKFQETQDKLRGFETATQAAEKRVKEAEERVAAVRSEVETYLNEIQGQRQISIQLVAQMRDGLKVQQFSDKVKDVVVPADTADKARSGGSLFERRLWKNGTTIKIAFLDGSTDVRAKVKRVASEWTKYANLKFDFIDTVTGADARVSFKEQGSWALVGVDALKAPPTAATINFGWVDSNTPDSEIHRVVLHEFGHVLGLVEEMSNPNARIKWNTDALYKDLQGPPNFWAKAQVQATLLNKCAAKDCPNYRAFDPKSIMMFGISPSWTLDAMAVEINMDLSESDKAFVAQLYPKQ
jgi:hypothetical protein